MKTPWRHGATPMTTSCGRCMAEWQAAINTQPRSANRKTRRDALVSLSGVEQVDPPSFFQPSIHSSSQPISPLPLYIHWTPPLPPVLPNLIADFHKGRMLNQNRRLSTAYIFSFNFVLRIAMQICAERDDSTQCNYSVSLSVCMSVLITFLLCKMTTVVIEVIFKARGYVAYVFSFLKDTFVRYRILF